MLLYSDKGDKNFLMIIPKINQERKVKISPPNRPEKERGIRAFFSAPLHAALTLEAAVVLPMFLFAMIAAMQYGNAMDTAVRFGASLSETGRSMAAAAYAKRFGGDMGAVPEMAVTALSAAYAQRRVVSQVKDTSAVRNVNMLLSSVLQGDEIVDLVLTYRIRSPVNMVKLPGNFFLQRARVRAWTGRSAGGDGEDGEGNADGAYVYVTETGTVYHENPDCTHLRLSIREAEKSELKYLRNNSGGKYHDCERCGGAAAGDLVYVTSEGDRCHNSLSCSGLKRTVRQVARDELGGMRACSKCGKQE